MLPTPPENSIKRTPFPVSGASSDTPDIQRVPLKHRTDISGESQDNSSNAVATLSRLVKPPPGYADYNRFERRVDSGRAARLDDAAKVPEAYIVIGIFNGADRWPRERVVRIRHPSLLFWQMWWEIVHLRGVSYFLSLKDAKRFRLYKVRISGPIALLLLIVSVSLEYGSGRAPGAQRRRHRNPCRVSKSLWLMVSFQSGRLEYLDSEQSKFS